jgi:glucose/mannose-6-phosphate isomerase
MLDSRESLAAVDRRDMLGTIESMPKHLADGFRRGRMSGLPRFSPKNIVICAVGGSAIGGDLLCRWISESCDVHCHVSRAYKVPSFIDKGSLVIVASYSGNTEETLSMFEDARKKRAKMVAICSGGKLAEMADAHSVPYARIVSGLVPRASLGYMFGAMAGVVERIGVISSDKQVEEATRTMTQTISSCRSSVHTVDNPAKRLAHELFTFVPVVVGYGLSAPVAKRWANQFNENAKSMAYATELPEMDHNELVGWVQDSRSQGFSAVFLEYEHGDEMLKRRSSVTRSMLSKHAPIHIVNASGVSPLAKMMSLVVIGDFTSAYLGILRDQDPSATEPIDELKSILSKK